ncbi:hypothetical protein E4U49_001008 [Claviceps purpurea]|nr:hypothetical protein E4U49_001008 [Claviceps purpurea]
MENFPSSHSAPAKRAPDWRKLKDFNRNRLLNRGSTCAIVDEIKYLRSISKDRHPRNGPGPLSADPVDDEPKTLGPRQLEASPTLRPGPSSS